MKSVLTVSILVIALLAKPYTFAQTFSYDGNRWYEIEVSYFY